MVLAPDAMAGLFACMTLPITLTLYITRSMAYFCNPYICTGFGSSMSPPSFINRSKDIILVTLVSRSPERREGSQGRTPRALRCRLCWKIQEICNGVRDSASAKERPSSTPDRPDKAVYSRGGACPRPAGYATTTDVPRRNHSRGGGLSPPCFLLLAAFTSYVNAYGVCTALLNCTRNLIWQQNLLRRRHIPQVMSGCLR